MRLSFVGLGLLLGTTSAVIGNPTTTSSAHASTSTSSDVALGADGRYPIFPSEGEGHQTARQLVPDAPAEQGVTARAAAGTFGLAQTRVIFLNKDGVILSPGSSNDAVANKSTIASKLTVIPPWIADEKVWSATVSCVRDMFAPFAVKIVTADPGSTPHLEAVFGGSASQLGLAKGIVGISPFTSTCGVIERSMVFTFTEDLPANPRLLCEIMAQEIAHSYGLDHEMLASDPMTYLPYAGNRWFRDETAACGEKQERPCGINGNTCRANQNSVALLRERLGVADPTLPTGEVMSPADGDLVPPDFDIEVVATDNIGVASVEFFVDEVSVGTKTSPPYTLTTSDIAVGQRTVTAVIADQARNEIKRSVSVTVEAAPSTGGCSTGGAAGAAGLLPLGLAALLLLRRRRVAA